MTTPRLDRVKIRNSARTLVIREAAKTNLPSGRLVADELKDRLPEYEVAEANARREVAARIAADVLPGADWLTDVLVTTFDYWLRPTCPDEHRFRILALLPYEFDLAIYDIVDPELLQTNDEIDKANDRFAALWFRFKKSINPRASHDPKFRSILLQYPTRVDCEWPLASEVETAPRSPHKLTPTHARWLTEYQFGRLSLAKIAERHGCSRQAAQQAIRRAAEIAGVTLREPHPAGRPVNG